MTSGGSETVWDTAGGVAFEHVSYLARSRNRVAVLDALSRSSWRRHELREAVDASRPTLARILAEFDTRGWVERNGDEYTATTTGSLVADELLDSIDAIATVDRLSEFLEAIPPGVAPRDPAVLSGAALTEAEPGSPFRPVARFRRLVEDTETFRELNPFALGGVGNIYPVIPTDRDRTATIVVGPSVVESLSADLGRPLSEVVADRAVEVRVHESIPIRLSLFDDAVALGEYDSSTGVLSRLLEVDAPDALQWAERTFEAYRSEAVPLEAFDGDVGRLEDATPPRPARSTTSLDAP